MTEGGYRMIRALCEGKENDLRSLILAFCLALVLAVGSVPSSLMQFSFARSACPWSSSDVCRDDVFHDHNEAGTNKRENCMLKADIFSSSGNKEIFDPTEFLKKILGEGFEFREFLSNIIPFIEISVLVQIGAGRRTRDLVRALKFGIIMDSIHGIDGMK